MDKQLLDKYLKGHCTPQEEEAVRAYLQGNDISQLDAYIDDMEKEAEDALSMAEKEARLQMLHQEIKRRERSKVYQFRKLGVAASIAVVFLLSAGAFYWKIKAEKERVQPLAWTTIDNPANQVKKLTLPDGTKIWLNGHSALSYSEAAYNEQKREVTIRGEGYFDVAHNPGRPFIVHAGKVTTTVLGTAFNVESYPLEKDVRVILVRGKVQVNAGNGSRVLRPGQLLSYHKAKGEIAVNQVSTSGVADWTQGKLVFSDLPLADVFSRLEQIYTVRIGYEPQDIANMRLTGSYERKRPEELLKKILFIHGLHYQKKGERYIIKP